MPMNECKAVEVSVYEMCPTPRCVRVLIWNESCDRVDKRNEKESNCNQIVNPSICYINFEKKSVSLYATPSP
jgi:hypothetical protein